MLVTVYGDAMVFKHPREHPPAKGYCAPLCVSELFCVVQPPRDGFEGPKKRIPFRALGSRLH
eukprot:13287703-Alexandrium_andersonii.AAC.1